MFTLIRFLLTVYRVVFTSHDLTFKSRVGGDGGGDTGEKATEPATANRDCASTFASIMLRDIFKETSGQYPAVFMVTITDIFGRSS